MNIALFLTALVVALAALFVWYRDREREVQRRIDGCPHPPAQQKTIRVNNVMNIYMAHQVIPGRRWLVKHCLACGYQRRPYSPTLQPYDEFVAEYNQETLDREVQFNARTQEYLNEKEWKERIRMEKRKKGMDG